VGCLIRNPSVVFLMDVGKLSVPGSESSVVLSYLSV